MFKESLLFLSVLQEICFIELFLIIQKSFIGEPMCFFEKTQILNLERFEKPYYSSRILQQVCYFLPFFKTSIFLRETHLLFQKTQTLNLFRIHTLSVAIYGKFATSWFKHFKHLMNQRWLVYESSLDKHGVKTGIDLRRRFCFPYLKNGTNWNQWEMSFCKFFVTKTSIRLFSSNEHETNLNKRRRQLQSTVLGVLLFLWRNFSDF